ncbi:MAG TPA: flagellar hook-basal body complex protein FliE [Patescibacteria group bacterium]|nr:flagellar hook-basal body complex protein FliE [Patescibacteria group bacterium]
MANVTDASKAYLNTLKSMTEPKPAETGGPSFGEVLKTAAESAINAQHQSEKVSAAGLVGKADMTDVLSAINNAEMALNTVLAVRDRVVQAYEQVMRTSI